MRDSTPTIRIPPSDALRQLARASLPDYPTAEDLFDAEGDIVMTDIESTSTSTSRLQPLSSRLIPWRHKITDPKSIPPTTYSKAQATGLHLPVLCQSGFKRYSCPSGVSGHIKNHHVVQSQVSQRVCKVIQNPRGDGKVLVVTSNTDQQLLDVPFHFPLRSTRIRATFKPAVRAACAL